MSVPHTGKLEARIKGHRCHFNGNEWTTPDPELTAFLNEETENSPRTHYSIPRGGRFQESGAAFSFDRQRQIQDHIRVLALQVGLRFQNGKWINVALWFGA